MGCGVGTGERYYSADKQIMMAFSGEHQIWLCTIDTDMRKSFDGLVGLVRKVMKQNPVTGDWFVFVNRRRTMMKVLHYSPGGYCVWCKRLEQGTFARLSGDQMSMGELLLLIEGGERRHILFSILVFYFS